MGKRIAAGVIIVALVVAGTFIGLTISSFSSVRAGSGPKLELAAYAPALDPNAQVSVKEGGGCVFPYWNSPVSGSDHQIILRNQEDKTVAVVTLNAGAYEKGQDSGYLQCVQHTEIQLPTFDFVTAYLDDTRLTTYSADSDFSHDNANYLIVNIPDQTS